MRVLLTGATGFLGRNVLVALCDRGVEVTAAYRTEPGPRVGAVQWLRADLTDPTETARLVREAKATHLLHLGWRAVYGDVANSRQNLDWLQYSLILANQFVDAGGIRIVGCGTCFEYDWNYGICREDFTPLAPSTLYGASKHALHVALEGLAKQAGISFGWGRVFFIYGPGEHSSRLVAAVIRALLDNRPAETTHGRQIRDYLYIKDAAAGIVSLVLSNAKGTFNIATGRVTTLREMICEIAEQVGRPDLVRLGARLPQPFEPPIILGDTNKAREILGFEAKTELKDGLAATIAATRDPHPLTAAPNSANTTLSGQANS
jgi:nucleoside-diphosphate-sugar epimerase